MRLIKYAVLAVLAIGLVTVCLANRQMVTLNLLPADLAGFMNLPLSIELPLFVVVFAGVIVGLVIGFLIEWLREHKHRAAAVRARSEAARMEREVKKARGTDSDDDVLALLEGAK